MRRRRPVWSDHWPKCLGSRDRLHPEHRRTGVFARAVLLHAGRVRASDEASFRGGGAVRQRRGQRVPRRFEGEGDWSEAGYWMRQIRSTAAQREIVCLITPIVCEEQLSGRRKSPGLSGAAGRGRRGSHRVLPGSDRGVHERGAAAQGVEPHAGDEPALQRQAGRRPLLSRWGPASGAGRSRLALRPVAGKRARATPPRTIR